MKRNSGLVSVYIPTHNRVDMVMRAIYSVLTQTHRDIEVVVCDDASSDDTYEIISRNFKGNSRVIILRNEQPMGANYSRNRAILASSGDFVTGLDDDDYFLPNRIDSFLKNYSDKYSFLFTRLLNCSKNRIRENESYIGELSLNKLLSKNLVGNQIFVSREKLIKAGLFDENLPAWQDYDCWIRLQSMYGNSLGLDVANYVMDTSHESPRITISNKVDLAIEMFLDKHNKLMSPLQVRCQLSEKFLISGQDVTLLDLFKYSTIYDFKRYVYRLIKR